MDADSLAAKLVLTFFTGLSIEHNLSLGRRSIVRKIEDLMSTVRTLYIAFSWHQMAHGAVRLRQAAKVLTGGFSSRSSLSLRP
jgi:hypothetical protein